MFTYRRSQESPKCIIRLLGNQIKRLIDCAGRVVWTFIARSLIRLRLPENSLAGILDLKWGHEY